MKRHILAAAGVGGLVLAAGTVGASAKDVDILKRVQAGKPTLILPHSSFRGDCETKVPVIKILDKPDNGEARVRNGPRKFKKGGKGRMAKCDGKTGVAGGVFYKSKDGFEGFDKVRYEVTFASGRTNIYKVKLRVGNPKSASPGGWVKPK